MEVHLGMCVHFHTLPHSWASLLVHALASPCLGHEPKVKVATLPKKNYKLKICIDFRKLNATTKKNPYPLLFTDEMLNTITWYETYSFLDGYSVYHQIFIA
jgi:hypothetical protein